MTEMLYVMWKHGHYIMKYCLFTFIFIIPKNIYYKNVIIFYGYLVWLFVYRFDFIEKYQVNEYKLMCIRICHLIYKYALTNNFFNSLRILTCKTGHYIFLLTWNLHHVPLKHIKLISLRILFKLLLWCPV